MRSRKLVSLLALSVTTSVVPVARAGCLPDTIPDNGYLGIGDPDSNGFGSDAGMLCCPYIVDPSHPAAVTDVDVSIAMTHSWVGDLVIKLRSPTGTISTLQSCAGTLEPDDTASNCPGDSSDWDGSTILYDDQSEGPSAESMGSGLSTDQKICIDDGKCAYTPSPGAGQGDRLDTDYDGEDPVGTWELCIGDRAGPDPIATWSLYDIQIETERSIPCACEGKFRGGDRVRYAPILAPIGPGRDDPNRSSAGPEGGDLPAADSPGEVMCGLVGLTDFVLVQWEGFSDGHDGLGECMCPLGSLPPATNSGFYVTCDELVLDLPWSDDFETGNTNHWTFTAGAD